MAKVPSVALTSIETESLSELHSDRKSRDLLTCTAVVYDSCNLSESEGHTSPRTDTILISD